MLGMRYENLVTNPIHEANCLLDFLGISMPRSRNIFLDFITQNASPNSIGNWKKELSDEQAYQVDREIGTLLRALGYDDHG